MIAWSGQTGPPVAGGAGELDAELDEAELDEAELGTELDGAVLDRAEVGGAELGEESGVVESRARSAGPGGRGTAESSGSSSPADAATTHTTSSSPRTKAPNATIRRRQYTTSGSGPSGSNMRKTVTEGPAPFTEPNRRSIGGIAYHCRAVRA